MLNQVEDNVKRELGKIANLDVLFIGSKSQVPSYVFDKYNLKSRIVDPVDDQKEVSTELQEISSSDSLQNVKLLWVQCYMQHTPELSRRKTMYWNSIAKVIKLQKVNNGYFIVEGKATHFPQSDSYFHKTITTLFERHSFVNWCGYGIKTRNFKPLCGRHLIYSYPVVAATVCTCRASNKSKYNSVHAKLIIK